MSKRNPPPLRSEPKAGDGSASSSANGDLLNEPNQASDIDFAIGGAPRRPQGPMYSIRGGPREFVDEPDEAVSTLSPLVERRINSIVERIQVGDTAEGAAAVRELLEIVEDRLDDVIQGRVNTPPAQSMTQRFAELDVRQGIYLAASGTLTQFNAILAAVHGAALTTVELGVLKASLVAALITHVVAAFFLCWAARPVDGSPNPNQTAVMALAETHALTDDTFRNYRRGWRMTLVALAISAAAAGLFILHSFGISFLRTS